MKKLITIMLTVFLSLGVSNAAFAADINVTVENKAVTWTDAKPFINKDNRTLVPLRPIAEAMGLNVQWYDSLNMAMFSSPDGFVEFTIGSKTYECGNMSGSKKVSMDTAAVIADGRTYAPARYLAEAFGYNVGWNANTNTVIISKGAVENVMPAPKPAAKPVTSLKLDPLPPDNYLKHPDWYGSLTPAHTMSNERLVAEYEQICKVTETLRTEATLTRENDLWATLSIRVDKVERYQRAVENYESLGGSISERTKQDYNELLQYGSIEPLERMIGKV